VNLETEINAHEVGVILDAMLKSDTASEFCRSIVHADFTGASAQGCQLFFLDNRSRLSVVAGYGLSSDAVQAGDGGVSAWDNNPLSRCIREKQHLFEVQTEDGKALLCIPLLKDQLPVGALCVVVDSQDPQMPIAEALIPIISKLGAYILATMATKPGTKTGVDPNANGEDLTSRQIQILELMAEGMVNVEIAGQMLLSESTIRQETVRIYRALGVPNRAEASKKARALGIIGRRPNMQVVS
jgi:DNA-binding CsgD family transcriptional regulator